MKILTRTLLAILAIPVVALGDEPAAGTLIQLNSMEGLVTVGLAFFVLDYFRRRQRRNGR
ncbi:MAG: hypothetical protein ACLFRP_08265 [Puniceicoccaceae bacterium]